MNNTIFEQRKELKKNSHKIIKTHYLFLIFLMLVMTLFGTEFNTSLSFWGENIQSLTGIEATQPGPGNMLSLNDIFSPGEILNEIAQGRVAAGSEKASEKAQALRDKFADSKALGMTNGVLGQVVNSLASGQLLAHVAQTIRTVTRSDKATGIIFTLASFLWYALVFILVKNVFSAVIRRVYLAARTYRHLAFTDITWFAVIRKWFSACLVMITEYVYLFLWTLTIVGGFIKIYSYWAVPYITAENPSVSPREAIGLSRRMMYGHKLELLKYQITFVGWHILSLVTYGLSDLLYGNAYRLAAYTEFYVRIRREMLEKEPDSALILNDRYLFQTADRITLAETYFDAVDEITVLHENKVTPTGWRKRVSDWFGIWLYSLDQKKLYDEQEERTLAIRHSKLCLQGLEYPQRLSPLWGNRRKSRPEHFSFIRNYTVWSLILLFISFCFIGWTWEVALHFMQTGQFANRGTLHGPWLPIYGSGGLVVLILCSRFRKNFVAEFFTAIVLCGLLEYVSAWSLETKYHQRWWSYDGYFLNLHGRICAEGLLVFGVLCCCVVYVIAPAFDHMISKLNRKALIAACLVLGSLYTADLLYSRVHPNMAEGAVERAAYAGKEVSVPDPAWIHVSSLASSHIL